MKSVLSFAACLITLAGALHQEPYFATSVVPATPDCTFRPTQTITATEGCPTTCATVQQCYADSAIVLGCGCSRMDVEPTTTTVCPTTTDCVQCTTGWGIAVVTPTTCALPAGEASKYKGVAYK